MKALLKSIFSVTFAGYGFLIVAIFCAVATFVEAKFGTEIAITYFYKSLFLEILFLYLVLNLIYNLYKFKLFHKIPIFLFHASFILIAIGALITRYFAVEGIIHIRQGEVKSDFDTLNLYLQFKATKGNEEYLAKISDYIDSNSKINSILNLDKIGARLEINEFVQNANYEWVDSDESGSKPVAVVNFFDDFESKRIEFLDGFNLDLNGINLSFNGDKFLDEYLDISFEDGKFYISSSRNILFTNFVSNSTNWLIKNQKHEFNQLGFYQIDEVKFSPSFLSKSAKLAIKKSSDKGFSIAFGSIYYQNKSKKVEIILLNEHPAQVKIDDVKFEVLFAPLKVKLPFEIQLKNLNIQRYPGSQTLESYTSLVEIKDKFSNFNSNISLNNFLDKDGYRIYQHSFDSDELGVLLSVNKDPGKNLTYIGYAILFFGLVLTLFSKNSRFITLIRRVNYAKVGNFILIFMLFSPLFADKIDHLNALNSLPVQSFDGRIEPFDTMSRNLVRKLHSNDKFQNMSATEFIIRLKLEPMKFIKEPIFKIKNRNVREILGLENSQKYASFENFYEINSQNKSVYKLKKELFFANKKPQKDRDEFEKEIINLDEKLNIFYMIMNGNFFRVIPKIDDQNRTWHDPFNNFDKAKNSEFEHGLDIANRYFNLLYDALILGQNWNIANNTLIDLKEFQEKNSNIKIDKNRLYLEVLYNKFDIFKALILFYLFVGIVTFFTVIYQIFTQKTKIFTILTLCAVGIFILHTLNLALRWYVSNHAPWSNAYESLIYISCALAFSGILFARASKIALSLSFIFAGVVQFIAHLSHIDPQITNITPILDSYYLILHVCIITASYGFFGLCFLLGMFNLILFWLFDFAKNNTKILQFNIAQTTNLAEISMILGLVLLTIGNFLGAIWANESWGRYWAWDSKESWSFISILIYAFIVHLRLMPKLNSQIYFSILCVVGFFSILMTYFGVNFYLNGKHSYASGDGFGFEIWEIIYIFIFFVIIFYPLKNRKFSQKL